MKKINNWLIGGLIAFVLWLLYSNRTKVASVVTQAVSGDVGGAVASSFGLISDKRKKELKIISDNIYNSLNGVGAKIPVFIANMIKVNSDVEYEYLHYIYGMKKRKDLTGWIKKEILITNKVAEQVNSDYRTKGMLTQIEN